MLTVADIHTYYGKSYVLHGVSLEVRPGEIVALLGRNGVGKTTALKSIMGLVPPRQGHVYFHEQELTALPPYRVGALPLGYVPQGRRIFPELTVWENLLMGVGGAEPAPGAIARVLQYFPILGERMRQRGGTLSGGEQQMLAIARALVKQPTMILMDEPSEGLAPLVARTVRETIRGLNKEGLSILLVEQQVAMALELGNRIYIMEKGKIVYEGTGAELRRSEEVLVRYLGVTV